MNTKSVNSAAGVILAALQQNRVPAGIALALDSAGLLMTPETAKELADLRARVAELEPQDPPVDADRAKAPWGRGEDGRPLLPMGAHWTDVPELVDRETAKIQGRVDAAQSGHWYDASLTETWRAPGTVCTRVEGAHRAVGRFTNVLPDDLELILHAHADLSWCLEMIAKFRARVAELEARLDEREQSADTYPPALPWAHAMSDDDLHGFLGDLVSAAMGRWQHSPEVPDREVLAAVEKACANWRTPGQGNRSDEPDESADAITRRIAPTQALREPEPQPDPS